MNSDKHAQAHMIIYAQTQKHTNIYTQTGTYEHTQVIIVSGASSTGCPGSLQAGGSIDTHTNTQTKKIQIAA